MKTYTLSNGTVLTIHPNRGKITATYPPGDRTNLIGTAITTSNGTLFIPHSTNIGYSPELLSGLAHLLGEHNDH